MTTDACLPSTSTRHCYATVDRRRGLAKGWLSVRSETPSILPGCCLFAGPLAVTTARS